MKSISKLLNQLEFDDASVSSDLPEIFESKQMQNKENATDKWITLNFLNIAHPSRDHYCCIQFKIYFRAKLNLS